MHESWAAVELQDLDLGDARRTRRAIQTVETLAMAPQASVPAACGQWAATKAVYRFWDNPAVDAGAIRAAHAASAVRRMAGVATVLVIQDTTQLDFTSHPSLAGTGKLAHPAQRGVLVHTSLAVRPDGVPLGIVAQQTWVRPLDAPPTRQARRQKMTAAKESQRWLDGLQLAEQAIPAETAMVMLADREADIFDLFAAPRRAGSDWLIRATHDRRLAPRGGEEQALLWATVAATPVGGEVTVSIPRARLRQERTATLSLRWSAVTLRPPRHRVGAASQGPVAVWAVLAEEVDPPPDSPPICWRLLTSLPVTDLAGAVRCVAWYRLRWLIERYHYMLKAGCRLEALQLQSLARLERALATYALVSWRILWLSLEARRTPAVSCEVVLARHEWQALACGVQRTTVPPEEAPSLGQAVRWIGQLGGFLGRTGDGEPGVQVLWRGMQKLEGMVAMWVLLRGIDPQEEHTGGLLGNG